MDPLENTSFSLYNQGQPSRDTASGGVFNYSSGNTELSKLKNRQLSDYIIKTMNNNENISFQYGGNFKIPGEVLLSGEIMKEGQCTYVTQLHKGLFERLRNDEYILKIGYEAKLAIVESSLELKQREFPDCKEWDGHADYSPVQTTYCWSNTISATG